MAPVTGTAGSRTRQRSALRRVEGVCVLLTPVTHAYPLQRAGASNSRLGSATFLDCGYTQGVIMHQEDVQEANDHLLGSLPRALGTPGARPLPSGCRTR